MEPWADDVACCTVTEWRDSYCYPEFSVFPAESLDASVLLGLYADEGSEDILVVYGDLAESVGSIGRSQGEYNKAVSALSGMLYVGLCSHMLDSCTELALNGLSVYFH